MKSGKAPGLWDGQFIHLLGLLAGLALMWTHGGDLEGDVLIAFWMAVAVPVVHQIYVWLTWRLELQSALISRSMGFTGYLIGFFVLFGARFVSLAWLGWLDRESLPMPVSWRVILTVILVVPGIWLMISVWKYFGFQRAAGGDHFEEKFREMPLVKEGIFKYTSNGMYHFGFLLFWAIAVGFGSVSAIMVAGFSHAYIWIHWFATEKPDLEFLHGGKK